MTVARSVADVLAEHVAFEVECIDRMYLNVYVPQLQHVGGVVWFFRGHRGARFASSALMDPISKEFVGAIHRFARDRELPQAICDRLGPAEIDALLRKWLAILPHPFPPADRDAGYRYQLSILQAEFSLTQMLDRPLSGRVFFEEVIRENLDLGRPDKVSLIFDRRAGRRTPSAFRTRVLTETVVPSLHVDYKHSKIKQYHKEGRALRTETTVNDTRDFEVRKGLAHLPELREIGFSANRRLLRVEQLSHDPIHGEDVFTSVTTPVQTGSQRAAGLRFDQPRTQALLSALVVFRLLPRGFTNADLRRHLTGLLGLPADGISPGRMTYDLRRLRLHQLIERVPGSHRYQVTDLGWKTALLLTRTYIRLLRPGLAHFTAPPELAGPGATTLRRRLDQLDTAIHDYARKEKLTA